MTSNEKGGGEVREKKPFMWPFSLAVKDFFWLNWELLHGEKAEKGVGNLRGQTELMKGNLMGGDSGEVRVGSSGLVRLRVVK